jgi:plastocyanin
MHRAFARAAGVAGFLLLAGSSIAISASEKSFSLTIKDHRFVPATLTVPAGEAFALTVINSDPTAEEFESQDFHVEKIVSGGKQITVHVGPLTAGSYGFFGERHMDTALGNLFAE